MLEQIISTSQVSVNVDPFLNVINQLDQFHLSPDLVNLSDYCFNARRELHKIPELSGEEFKTSVFCQKLMKEAGFVVTTYEKFTGFIADLTINSSFSRIAFRADMDALEMQDMTSDAYTSTHDGKAHNCGHDSHMAIALTTAKYLAEHQIDLKYNLRFIFQMAEEDMRIPGACKMVELGCMEGVQQVYGLHNDANLECGTVNINNGIMSSYGSAWTLNI